MTRTRNRLSAREVETAAVGVHSDGGNLSLRVRNGGSRSWVLRYARDRKITEIGLGSAKWVSLKLARQLRDRHFATLAKSQAPFDPTAEEQRQAQAELIAELRLGRIKLTRREAPDLTHLYRHYNHAGHLLYVGISKSAGARWAAHKRSSWFDHVAVIAVDHYPTREAAEAAEVVAILAEQPTFNRRVPRLGPAEAQARLNAAQRKTSPDL